jgi:hypothetical protein
MSIFKLKWILMKIDTYIKHIHQLLYEFMKSINKI